MVPGFADLQRMAMLLIAERSPGDARLLILGAGGGLEIKSFAEARPGWTFDGVDPSAEMLKLAKINDRTLCRACSDSTTGSSICAPDGPFDAATCLLTLHFIEREDRLRTLKEVHRRLSPGAPFVAAHFSFSQGTGDRELWLSRYAAFATASGIERSKAENARSMIGAQLPILSPEDDEKVLRDAGFRDIDLFYAGFSFRGWVAYA